MRTRLGLRTFCASLFSFILLPGLAPAIELLQVDDFQDGLQAWRTGENNPNFPEAVPGLGPAGIGDQAMRLTASGAGSGSKLVVFNTNQWSGDYVAAGVTGIRLDVRNLSQVDLTLRLGLRGAGGAYATAGILLPGGGDYRTLTFSLLPDDLTPISGAAAEETLQDLSELRILHSTAPATSGEVVEASIAVDNITAIQVPECDTGIKADAPASVLFLPAYEVDTSDPSAVTTLFSVHNQADEPTTARVSYFDRASNLRRQDDLLMDARQTRSVDVRKVAADLVTDDDGVARGWIQVQACGVPRPSSTAPPPKNHNMLWGDYVYLDRANAFASGDLLLAPGDLCSKMETRLIDFGSGVRLRLFLTDPQGEQSQTPSVTLSAYNEPGQLLESEQIFTDDSVLSLALADLFTTRFGVLTITFAGSGAATVEYSAFGRFSVAMNAVCTD